MYRFKKLYPSIILTLAPILWGVIMSMVFFSILQTVELQAQKLDEIILLQQEGLSSYSVELETFSESDGRMLYVIPVSVPLLPTAEREYFSQIGAAFASCESGSECLDSVHVWLYKDTPKGTYIVRDTALSNAAQ